jgi:hypothetical protein
MSKRETVKVKTWMVVKDAQEVIDLAKRWDRRDELMEKRATMLKRLAEVEAEIRRLEAANAACYYNEVG